MSDAAAPILHRLVPVRVMTHAGWVAGNVHVPITRRFLEAWRLGHAFVSLTDAEVEGFPRPIPFFAVHRTAVQFLLVDDAQPLEVVASTRPFREHHVTCLLASGRIMGVLRVPQDVRLSDYVTHQETGLLVLEQARVDVRDPWSQALVQLSDQRVVVDPRAVVGISELGPGPR